SKVSNEGVSESAIRRTTIMKDSSSLFVAVGLILFTAGLPVAGLAAEDARIDGKWFAYPGRVDPVELVVEPPPPIPDPPLKPEYLTAWQELRASLQAAEDRGEPIATGYTQCLPDGMPAMMQGMFPMEVLE